MKADEVMTKGLVTVTREDRASSAGRLMWDNDCGAIPVVGDDGRAIGMVTDRDICMSAVLQDRAPSEISVSEAMSKSLVACRTQDDLEKAEDLMARHQVRRVPVLDDDGRPVGIVSLADLARASGRQSRGSRTRTYARDLTPTLAVISEPHQPA